MVNMIRPIMIKDIEFSSCNSQESVLNKLVALNIILININYSLEGESVFFRFTRLFLFLIIYAINFLRELIFCLDH